MSAVQCPMKSKIGMLYIVASEKGLRGIYWDQQSIPLTRKLNILKPADSIIAKVIQQLDEYFQGKRKSFNIQLDFNGTTFQKQVWKELTNIPFGKTVSYKNVAERIKNPKAVRAVGTANGKNPFCIIVPCHRVIAANGTIGGYGGGIPVKQKLLQLEGVTL